MYNKPSQKALVVALSLTAAPLSQAAEILFFQDFGCDGMASSNCGAATTPPTWTLAGNSATNTTGGTEPGKRYTTTRSDGVVETIFADDSTSTQASSGNFSVTGKNWNIHKGSQNTQASGYRSPNSVNNPNMSGNMLGHQVGNSDYLPNTYEDNFYQISNLSLDSDLQSAMLTFDFDSLIRNDGDGFAVAVSNNSGTTFSLLTPVLTSANADSDMQYRSLTPYAGDLRIWTGQTGSTQTGFDGNGSGQLKAGTAMFDLTAFKGQTIQLRFAYASNSLNGSTLSSEGINIDNIKVSGVCTTGTGPTCDTPNTTVPEPASLGLALLGLTGVAWRRRAKRS